MQKEISFFSSLFSPQLINERVAAVVSSYLSGEGLPGLLDLKPEHLCSCIILMRVKLIVEVSDDIFITKKQRQR